tara:strand:- start:2700 stop:3884 length:1185 start_codon:yes stop_codon:yes gene_type:complete
LHAIPDILEDLRRGRMIVLVDDEQRENEGDLVCAGEFATAEVINFMITQGRGMLFVALAGEYCDRLDLTPQTVVNTTQRGTAYTISVDAHERYGITTGVSADDRATTVRVLSDPNSVPGDLARPGHVQPLRARDGGVLVRAGQTEGSVDLCRLAGLCPVGVGIEVMNNDGSMARRPQLEEICNQHDLKICSVADVIQYRLQREELIERIDEVPFDTESGSFKLIAYRSIVDLLPHVALVCGQVGSYDDSCRPIEVGHPVLVRMHSQNLLGDVLGDLSHPTGKTLHCAMRMIQDEAEGAVVYLRHEMTGASLLGRLQGMNRSTLPDVDRHLGVGTQQPLDLQVATGNGAYGIGSQILRDLGVRQLRLITDHPFHPTALEGFGLSIREFVPLDGEV